jgi:hypothetical protein
MTSAWIPPRTEVTWSTRWPQSVSPTNLAALERFTGEAPDLLPPTFKQRRYLRTLDGCAGQTFATPRTPAQASAEIRRLKAVRSAGFTVAELQAKQCAREVTATSQSCRPGNRRPRERRDLEPGGHDRCRHGNDHDRRPASDRYEAREVFYT